MLKAYRGSPPHARGKDHLVAHQLVHAGITPACAGKSAALDPRSRQSWDHPRMRGEKRAQASTFRKIEGSPPHARGKDIFRNPLRKEQRITPACAGKRAQSPRPHGSSPDHPRIRGEKVDGAERVAIIQGSPPHTRGKDLAGAHGHGLDRITPAYAGKSPAGPARPCTDTDHPRMRGEKPLCVSAPVSGGGSPPHARGKDLESPEKSTFLLCRTSDFI